MNSKSALAAIPLTLLLTATPSQASDIATRVKKLLTEHLGVDEKAVTETAYLIDDLGADSIDTVEIVMKLEEEFKGEISDEDCDSMITVKNVIDAAQKSISK